MTQWMKRALQKLKDPSSEPNVHMKMQAQWHVSEPGAGRYNKRILQEPR